MQDSTQETMIILAEECAEVIQAVSKIIRFGLDVHRLNAPLQSNRAHLEEEVGDMLAMIELLVNSGIITKAGIDSAKDAKIVKLKKWSTISNLDNI